MKKVSLVLALLAMVVTIAAWHLSKSRTFQVFGDLVARVDTTEHVVALTFDDGPWRQEYADQVLATLEKHAVKATFFLNGSGIEQNMASTIDLVSAGHQIGNHSYSHKRMIFMGLNDVKHEVESTTALIRQAGYKGEIYFRPPYGKKLFVLPYFLMSERITSITWDVEPETYPQIANNASAIAEHVIASAAPGSIILLHVLGSKNEASRNALPLIINGLSAKGYRFVTVSELLQHKV